MTLKFVYSHSYDFLLKMQHSYIVSQKKTLFFHLNPRWVLLIDLVEYYCYRRTYTLELIRKINSNTIGKVYHKKSINNHVYLLKFSLNYSHLIWSINNIFKCFLDKWSIGLYDMECGFKWHASRIMQMP